MSKKRIDQLDAKAGTADITDLVPIWDSATNTTKHIALSQIPVSFGGGGSGSVTVLGSPFKVFNGDANYVTTLGDSIITDVRLIGKTGYVVYSTQTGTEFRDSELTYDDINGKVTISDFVLDTDEHITIYADGVTTTNNYNGLLTDVSLLKLIAAPFYVTATGANGGMLLWKRPAADIPAGWQEVVDWRGRLPMGWDPTDDDFKVVRTSNGGSKTHTLTKNEMPAHAHKQGSEGLYDDFHDAAAAADVNTDPESNGVYVGERTYVINGQASYRRQLTSKVGGGSAHPILNPYRIVMFIEFIGI